MNTIRIDYGVSTSLTVDLTDFDFTGIEKVIMTAKNRAIPDAEVIFTREFTEAGEHVIIITPEESLKLTDGAVYDYNVITTDGKRYKNGDNGSIYIRRGVGQ